MLDQSTSELIAVSDIDFKSSDISIEYSCNCPGKTHWHLESVYTQTDPFFSVSARGIVIIKAIDHQAAPLRGVDVLLVGNAISLATTDSSGSAYLRVFDPIDPNTNRGLNTATVVDEPADEARGIGIVPHHFTSIELTYRQVCCKQHNA